MAEPQGRSLELYFIDCKPDGMLTAEVFNWTGHVLMTPRTQLSKALKREEMSRTGVYLLFGERDGEPLAYVGEAANIGRRLREHAQKDWWDTGIIVTTTGDALHKAHVKYLESRLVEIARDVGAMALDNGNTPPRSSLSEAHVANMEVFLDTLLVVLPALRIDMFLDKKRPSTNKDAASLSPDEPIFELSAPKHDITATAILENGDFVVQKGSLARGSWEANRESHIAYSNLYDKLVETGVLVPHGSLRTFTTNYAFRSTSAAGAAGAVVNGRTCNGPIVWKVKGTRKTYADWEAERVRAQDSGPSGQ